MRVPATLKLTVPLILLGFAAILSTVNLLYHVPQAERAAEEDSRKRLAQEMSRLQSTLEYLLLKGDLAAAQHEIAVLAHNHEFTLAALTDDRNTVIEATRRAWMGQQIAARAAAIRSRAGRRGRPRAPRRNDGRPERQRAARLCRHPDGRRARRAASHPNRQPVPRLRSQALQGGSSRAGAAAIALLGGMGDGARARHVAGVPLSC